MNNQIFWGQETYTIVRCIECESLFVSPRPTFVELSTFYNDPVYFEGSTEGYTNYMNDEHRNRRWARHHLKIINSLMPMKGNLLDLGCAAGFFLDEARKSHWNVAGTELSDSMRRIAKNKFGVVVELSSNAFPPNSFDVITMWEYIEHLIDPLEELRNIYSLLKPNGLLCISTPNTNHLQVKLKPSDWWEFKPPAHLTFFTVQTLIQLIKNANYEVVRVDYQLPVLPISGNWLFDRLWRPIREAKGRTIKSSLRLLFFRLVRKISLMVAIPFTSPEELCVGIDLYARKKVEWEHLIS